MTIFKTLPATAFWRTGVVGPGPFDLTGLFQPKFPVTRDLAIATAGSCFAQHVGLALRGAGLAVLDVEPAPDGMTASTARRFGYGLYSARYGNIYTAAQLRQLLEDTRDQTRRPAIWTREDRSYDALRPGVEPNGCATMAEVQALRRHHLSRLNDLFTRTALFVFTLGMTESWRGADGTVYPTAPGVIADPPDAVTFHNFTFAEVLSDLHAIRTLLHGFNPGMQMLLTVSPVPLTATVSGRHVLAATAASKATLRAAVDEFVRDLPDVDYVPSYEIIMHPAAQGRFFAENLRTVTQTGVDLVMSQFLAAHGLSPLPSVIPPPPTRHPDDPASDLICEEALAEAFNR